jgi:Lrp/AsnC family transcriptional regulator for asnA, asnC and gidA
MPPASSRHPGDPGAQPSRTRRQRSTPALDEIDKRIIEQLQQDGRRSYAAIAKAVELSEAAVDYVVITAGSLDLLVEVVCEDDDHLLEILSKRIRTIPTVRSTETFMYLKLVKQTYDWGAR